MSFEITPIISAFTTAVNGAVQFFADVVSAFFSTISAMGVPGILATLVAVGLITGLIARYFGFDILGLVRTVIGGLTARVTGAL
ncbi:MAG: hypothetical protein ACPL4I_10830 [Bacteroidota bacterium]|jgi:flagellar biosynthesis protein FliR